jgi:putative ABC transport system permease protein
MVVRGGVVLAVAGLGVGTLAGVFAARALADAITGVDPLDPIAFCAVAAVLLAVALFASYLPARRATQVDPMLALRCD